MTQNFLTESLKISKKCKKIVKNCAKNLKNVKFCKIKTILNQKIKALKIKIKAFFVSLFLKVLQFGYNFFFAIFLIFIFQMQKIMQIK